MKRSKKSVVTLILAVMMIAAMAVSAFAEEAAKANIKITNPNANEFSVYQVMKATQQGTDKEGNPLYVFEVVKGFEEFFDGNPYKLNEVNEIMVKDKDGNYAVLASDSRWSNDNTTAAASLATALAAFAQSKSIAATKITDSDDHAFDLGYYVIAQTGNGANDETAEVASKPILVDLTKGAANINPKNDTTTLEKKIVEGTNKVDANNVNIGDKIDYEITTKFPTYKANVDPASLKFTLTDTFSKGLTFTLDDADLVVKVGGNAITEGFTPSVAAGENGTTVLTIDFVKATIYANQGKSIVVTYSAKLNADAVIEGEGNPNDIKLVYTNNPDKENDNKELTDEVKSYTYGFKIHKVDKVEESKNLKDAKFEIKNDKNEIAYFTDNGNGKYTLVDFVGTNETAPANTTKEVVSQEGTGLAEVKGLDAGTYTLTETQAPDGYTKLADSITVTIEDKGVLESTTEIKEPNGIAVITVDGATIKDELNNTTGNVETQNGEIDLAVYVKNAKGISLPETGATSALVCMIGGALIVLIGLLYYFIAVRRSKKTSR